MTSSHIMPGIRNSGRLLSLLATVLVLHSVAHAEGTAACSQWIEKVTEGSRHSSAKQAESQEAPKTASIAPSSDPWGIASLTAAEKMKAIQCLLGAENDTKPAAFSGANRFDISQIFAPARVNLAALYAISYIYNGRYDHAGAVALRGEDASYTDSNGNYATKVSAIHKAYRAYRMWFVKVRQIGLAKAQQTGIQPLDGSGLRWY